MLSYKELDKEVYTTLLSVKYETDISSWLTWHKDWKRGNGYSSSVNSNNIHLPATLFV